MTLRRSCRPLRPDLDKFLFAAVGEEIDGIPLSTISALTRLGLDPWQEAGRLSSLARREAVEQLARLIAEIPGIVRPVGEAREIGWFAPTARRQPCSDPASPNPPALQQTDASKTIAILACLFCARRSRADEHNRPRRIYVRNWNSISGAKDRAGLGGAQNYRR